MIITLSIEEFIAAGIVTNLIYEKRPDIDIDTQKKEPLNNKEPLSNSNARRVLEVAKRFSFSNPNLDPYAAAGWVVVSILGGMLPWRPHVWVTGPSGAGKSTFLYDFVFELLGNYAIRAQGSTTEAGLRQMVNYDALPIVFDEADATSPQDVARLKGILDYARAASSPDGAEIVKGTPGGRENRYRPHNCMLFGSVRLPLSFEADFNRFHLIEMKKPVPNEKADREFRKKLQSIKGMTTGLILRTMQQADQILHNHTVFREIVIERMRDRRAGDLYGILLAGAYSLHDTNNLTDEAARAWLEQTGIELQKPKCEPDHISCLRAILDHRLKFNDTMLSVRQLAEIVNEFENTDKAKAKTTLKAYNLTVVDGYLRVPKNAHSIHDILRNTAWSNNWHDSLLRCVDIVERGGTRMHIKDASQKNASDSFSAIKLEKLAEFLD